MLPAVRTDEEWQAVVFDEKIVRAAAEDLAARLGLAGAGLRRYPGGSRPVYAGICSGASGLVSLFGGVCPHGEDR